MFAKPSMLIAGVILRGFLYLQNRAYGAILRWWLRRKVGTALRLKYMLGAKIGKN